jgi:hypothetical protein
MKAADDDDVLVENPVEHAVGEASDLDATDIAMDHTVQAR